MSRLQELKDHEINVHSVSIGHDLLTEVLNGSGSLACGAEIQDTVGSSSPLCFLAAATLKGFKGRPV